MNYTPMLELLKTLGPYAILVGLAIYLIRITLRHFHFRNNPRLAFKNLYNLTTEELGTLHSIWYGHPPYDPLHVLRLWQLGLVSTPIPFWTRGREVGSKHFLLRDFLELVRIDDYTLRCRYLDSKRTAEGFSYERGKSLLSAKPSITQEMLDDLRFQTWMSGRTGPLQREAKRRGIQLDAA